MSARIRLLVCDIDGTLVRLDKSLGAPVVEAAARLRKAGVRLSLISARPLSGMQPILSELRVSDPVGAYNGGTIARPSGELLVAHRLDRETAGRALELISQHWVDPWVFAGGRWHARTTQGKHVASERTTAAQEPVIVDDFTPLLERVDKMVGVSDDHDRLAGLEHEVAKALGREATVACSQPYYLDVTAPEANKGAGVTAIAKALGVGLDATCVIGDSENDIAMFRVAGLSVAMGQGAEAVKSAAKEVTRSNAEDGVAWAIDKIVLPRAGQGES